MQRALPLLRAGTSPSGLLLTGGAVAGSIVLGAPLAIAAVVGGLALGARMGFELVRNREERVDPFSLGEPWKRFVIDAQKAQSRFRRAVKRGRPGPLRDRLGELGERIDQAVMECWRVACQGNLLGGALKNLETERVEVELAGARDDLANQRGGSSASLEATVSALESQMRSAERLSDVWRNSRDRLRVLNAQLDEAVARAVELSVGAGDGTAVGGVSDQVAGVVSDMESLRQALEETGGTRAAPE